MTKELDQVVLTVDFPEHGLALDGETIAVVSLSNSQIRAVGPREIARTRPIEMA